MSEQRFSHHQLTRFAEGVYRAYGLPEADAALVADSLVQAELWGHASHGMLRTFWYGTRLKSGAIQARTELETVMDGGAMAVMDGHNGVGQVIAARAMESAINRARQHGVGLVSVRNSGHFGTAMYFTRMAVKAGCIGLLSTNSSPAMAPWGGYEKRVGANPWSIAAPAGKFPPMVLDIGNTAVARGKLHVARRKGEAIPAGWATDAQGRPTLDPAEGIAGNILPIGGHKGYGIALMMDVLSGVLSGSGFGTGVVGPFVPEGSSGAGQLVMALHVPAFRPMPEFCGDMERLIGQIKSSPLAPGNDEILYPGEPEARAEDIARREGIALPAETVAELDTGARELEVKPLSEMA